MPNVRRRDHLGNGNVCSIAEIDADNREAHEISHIDASAKKHQPASVTRPRQGTYWIQAPMRAFPLISVQTARG
jgi:hypothetical protein